MVSLSAKDYSRHSECPLMYFLNKNVAYYRVFVTTVFDCQTGPEEFLGEPVPSLSEDNYLHIPRCPSRISCVFTEGWRFPLASPNNSLASCKELSSWTLNHGRNWTFKPNLHCNNVRSSVFICALFFFICAHFQTYICCFISNKTSLFFAKCLA